MVNSHTMRSVKGESMIDGVSTPQFSDTSKMAWDVKVLWSGSTNYGFLWREVFFPGDQLTISEGEDEVTISANGLVYGDVTKISVMAPTDLTGTTVQSVP